MKQCLFKRCGQHIILTMSRCCAFKRVIGNYAESMASNYKHVRTKTNGNCGSSWRH